MAATPNFDESALIDLAASCRYSPKRWSRVAWDWGVGELSDYDGPRPWQDDINDIIGAHLANPETRYQPLRVSVASGHGIGKSAEMGMLSNWAMSCFADCKIVTTANTEGQLRTKTAPEIGKWFRMSITSHWFDIQTMSIKSRDPERGESWRQDFIPWSEHNTEAFAGLHNKGKIILLLFDEASKIHDKVWEVAEGALTDENTVIIWVVFGNPTRNSGRFRECFRKFRHRWVGRQIDSRTVPGTNKQFLQQLVDDNGEDSDIVKVRVRGQFPSQSAMQFISADDVDAAQKVHLRKEQYSFAPVIISVDPAWSGDDSLEIMLRQGLYSKSLATMPKNDNDVHVANLIARLEDEYQADAVFIDAGYGTGIYSAGQVMGRSWRLIWFSGKAINPGYVNKRAEMWGTMKQWLKAGGAIDPKDEVLYQDLIGPETVPKLDGKIQLESKEDMKERGIPSPNRGDALALTFAEPVAKKVRVIGSHGTISPHQVEVEYSPLG
ncbi:terminase [Rhizobium lentis]|uniref:terminase n=1 Tax=Rhizobium lentis TaxID=1138194 RepID=UPI001C83753D|nr:terminase [Rhizobium lentis]MBX5020411.1 terminase [Rhizobium lentis]